MQEKTYLKRFAHDLPLPLPLPPHKPEPKSDLTTFIHLDYLTLTIITLLTTTSILLLSNSNTCLTSIQPTPLHIASHLSPATWTAFVSIQFSLFNTILLPRLLALFTSKSLTRKLTAGDGIKISMLLNGMESASLKTQYLHGNSGVLALRVISKALGFILQISCLFSFTTILGNGTGITPLGAYLQIFLLVAASCAIWVVFWSPLPLLGEWPAQWLYLLNEFDKEELRGGLEGTSLGNGTVRGDIGETRVWLCEKSRRGDEAGMGMQLRLSTTRTGKHCV
ncbi:uncharacterized protein PAC_05339 [Phialocephala subalpina]|uniref:Uncharacterized protein n=1 Tax=Phialocephala subalpina TaxID=576137 RepID=A0A1L7WRR3_9HELO|nr:uncharacterized protein PAC_05339 [Phialocephala subalpina]